MPAEPHIDTATTGLTTGRHNSDLRVRRATALDLIELDPRLVIGGEVTPTGLSAPPVMPVGTMREACPHCHAPLKLVLRYKHVIRSHLYCDQCTRCYDAVYANGRSALALTGISID
ncbi:hypothetical protein [Rhodoferax sp.]|uniref:hypothetical protein n=1 Tax=Rhodoferax sp. TaxID=50421 RepID=UPI002778C913|nr:hypothetical protein [Rhodoferax sp.]